MAISIDSPLEMIERFNREYNDAVALDIQSYSASLVDPIDEIAQFAQNLPGSRILDIGCGWGRYLWRFEALGVEYIGIDSSPEMLRLARNSSPHLRFELMTFRQLKFPDESFDGLWCCCAIGQEPKRNLGEVLKEMRRVLTDGGILMLITPDIGYSEESFEEASNGLLTYFSYWDYDELAEILVKAGFEIIESDRKYYDGAMTFLLRK